MRTDESTFPDLTCFETHIGDDALIDKPAFGAATRPIVPKMT